MAESNIRFRVDAREALQQIRQMSVASGRLAGSVARASTRLGGLQGIVGRLALAATTRSIVNQAASYKQLELRVKLLSQTYGETARLQAFAAKTARTFGMSSREALSGVTDLYARLRPMNITLEDIQTSFTGFNTVARLSGLTAAQSAGAFFQLSQALGSGRLQGDEFRSIAEQVPGLLTAVAKETGVAQTKLKEYASQGKLTSDIIIRALRRAEEEGGDSLRQLIQESPVQKFKDLSNATEELSIAVGSKLVPAVTPLVKAMTGIVKLIGALPNVIKVLIAGVMGLATAIAIAGPPMGVLIAQTKALTVALNTQNGTLLISKALIAGPYVAALVAAVAIGLKWWDVTKKQKAAQEALTGIIEKGTVAQQRKALVEQQQALVKAEEKLDRLRKRGPTYYGLGVDTLNQAEAVEKLRKRIDELKEALSQQNEEIDRSKGQMKGLTELYGKFDKKLKDLVDPINQIKTHSENMGQAFGNAFKGIISGSMSAGEALASFFKRVADSYLQMAADIAAAASSKFFAKILGTVLSSALNAGINSGGGFSGRGTTGTDSMELDFDNPAAGNWGQNNFASGGYVNGPTNALIGEGGEGEYVIPESKMNDAMARYSGGARGDAVLAGGGGDGEAGGISGGASGSIDVTFNTQVINDVSYVSYSEFQAGVQRAAVEGAKRGEQATLRRLQTSQSTRRRVGV